ncbi:MAG: hypothetical protein IJ087_13620 [Eggerthellaceae bacterium]|nr:hypothetical protein [Eggerthellaceae bacterium]
MCFRPSAVAGSANNQVQTGTCPSCGAPVAASIGIDSGTCPNCGKPIPTEPPTNDGVQGNANARIL